MPRGAIGFLLLLTFYFCHSVAFAFAFDMPVRCHRIDPAGDPSRSAIVVQPRPELWCYQRLSEPAGAQFIFNADGDVVRPELAMLVEADGVLTHGSMLAGEVTLHRSVASVFNPFSIPAQEPKSDIGILSVPPQHLRESAREVLKRFRSEGASLQRMSLVEGVVTETVEARALPWRGYWWSYKSAAMLTPLGKYDRFVQGVNGASPRARSWESRYHRYKGINWEGHCNGWAASAIIRAEPRVARRDPVTGLVFSVSDQKGILAETDYCVVTAFFGTRYRGRGNIRDIAPDLFHKTLRYYIGQLGKPVAFDYKRAHAVDNHIISGYEMEIERSGPNRFQVTTRLRAHKYDKSRSQSPGVAPRYTRTYRYTLTTDDRGEIVGGAWRSDNPDFLWVPLAPAECASNNPRVQGRVTEAILALPPAE